MSKCSREEVYAAIDSERDYQNDLSDLRTDGRDKSVGEYITMMQHYQAEMVSDWTRHPGDDMALEVMRKIAGIAVRCMEEHGVALR